MPFWNSTSHSDFPTDQNFHQFYDLDNELDIFQIASGIHGAFLTRGSVPEMRIWSILLI